jgi:hypothetical protein
MPRRRETFGNKLAKKSAKEAKRISKGVLREGRKIISGTIKGFFNVFNPFR